MSFHGDKEVLQSSHVVFSMVVARFMACMKRPDRDNVLISVELQSTPIVEINQLHRK